MIGVELKMEQTGNCYVVHASVEGNIQITHQIGSTTDIAQNVELAMENIRKQLGKTTDIFSFNVTDIDVADVPFFAASVLNGIRRDIAAELKDIENKINNAVIITSTEHNNLGKFITVRFLDENEEETYHLVGTIEADPLANKISDLSPLGKAIINAKQGSTVRVKTEDGEQFDVLIVKISKK
jgi:hypothetical protein